MAGVATSRPTGPKEISGVGGLADLARGGQPLSATTRAFFEPRFGRTLDHVRVHDGPTARLLNDQFEAKAFAFGDHIWLGRRARDNPGPLMAHELAHVVPRIAERPMIRRIPADPSTSLHPAAPPGPPLRCVTAFGADAEGMVPLYVTVGGTVPVLGINWLGWGIGGAIEVVFNCRSGDAHAFASFMIGVGPSWSATSISVVAGGGINFIYDLPTASAYAGHFVAITAGYTLGFAGNYVTGFTTPRGLVNLVTTRGFGGETHGFGAGWAFGVPSAGVLAQYEYFWDLGAVPFTAADFRSECTCPPAIHHPYPQPADAAHDSQRLARLNSIVAPRLPALRESATRQVIRNLPAAISTASVRQQVQAAEWSVPRPQGPRRGG